MTYHSVQQYCRVCGTEFMTPTLSSQIKTLGLGNGRYSSEDTCKKCLKEVETRLAEFKNIYPQQGVATAVLVWRFDDGPEVYKNMSNNGGDEDWIALIPPGFYSDYMPIWVDNLDTCHDPQIYEIAQGYKIVIGSHA